MTSFENTPYDLLIKGGRVIDPASSLDGRADLAIADGRIAALAPNIPANQARQVIDASGMLVVPGLVDLHTHLGFEVHRQVVPPDAVCPQAGVATAVDMGTTGAFAFPWYRSRVLERCHTRLFEFLNISSLGTIAVHTPYYVEHYGAYVDVPDTIRTIEENREYIRGIKVFASSRMVGEWSLIALRAARQVADVVDVPIAVHIGGAPPALEEILELLTAGDILTHSYTPGTQGILDESGTVRPAVREARQRGVKFDIGHGSGSFDFEVARRALEQDLAPDSISTDIYHSNVDGPVKDLLVTATKFLALGMPFDDVMARITIMPARMIGEESLASLAVGGVADVALLTLREGDFVLEDARHQVLRTDRLLQCERTLYKGKVIHQRMDM